MVTETDPLGRTTTYAFDAASQLTSVTDRLSRQRSFLYDNAGRRTAERWHDGGGAVIRTISYAWDADSRLTSVSDPDATYAYGYDSDDRLTSVNNTGTPGMPNVVLTFSYDARDNRTLLTDNLGGRIDYTYDLDERMTSAMLSVNGPSAKPKVEFTYDAASRLTSLTRSDLGASGGGAAKILTTIGYNAASRPTSISHAVSGGATLASYSLTWNAAGELTQEVSNDGTANFGYNSTGQLTSVTGWRSESYSYDALGNRTMSGYQTGTGNRLLSDGVFNYQYDFEGNMTRKTEIATGKYWEYTWDHRNRLTRVLEKTASGQVLKDSNYKFDPFDKLIKRSVDPDGPGPQQPAVTWTAYDGVNPYADFNGSGTLTHRYLHGPAVDMILARVPVTGAMAWYLTNHLGSVRDLASNMGSVLDHIKYNSFGNIISESNPSVGDRFKFTGRERESATDDYYHRARWYDDDAGRFLLQDPIGFAAGDANLYRYSANLPTVFTDPMGHKHNTGALTAGKFPRWWQAKGITADQLTKEIAEAATASVITVIEVALEFIPGGITDEVIEGGFRLINRTMQYVLKYGNGRVAKAVMKGAKACSTSPCFVAGTQVLLAKSASRAQPPSGSEASGRDGVLIAGAAVVGGLVGWRVARAERRRKRLDQSLVDAAFSDESPLDIANEGEMECGATQFAHAAACASGRSIQSEAGGERQCGYRDCLHVSALAAPAEPCNATALGQTPASDVRSAKSSKPVNEWPNAPDGRESYRSVRTASCDYESTDRLAPAALPERRPMREQFQLRSLCRRAVGACLLAAIAMFTALAFGPSRAAQRGGVADQSTAATATKSIEDIQAGDFVLAWDEATARAAPKRVTRVFRRTSDHLRILTLRAATGRLQTIKTTDEHPFWVPGRGWVEAGQLELGQQVHSHDGHAVAVVSNIHEAHPEGVPVYNFEVEGYHTYFVAAHGSRAPPILVHNSCKKVMHHGIPKAIIKEAPDGLRKDLLGRRGKPNKIPVDEDMHIDAHAGRNGLPRYNDEFRRRLGQHPTVDDYWRVRDEMLKDYFGIDPRK